jgi:cell division protein FtsB
MVGIRTKPPHAQDFDPNGTLRLYVDPNTHVVYTQPGRGRRLLARIPASALSNASIEQEQQKTEEQLHENQRQISALTEKNDQLELSNHTLTQQMAEIRPSWQSYIENFQNKFRLGTLVYGDYRFYSHTGFQPQELTQLTNPGPGNNAWSSFDITRAYLNFFFFPTKDWTLRVTPNLYKTIGSANDKIGQSTSFGSNLDGDLGYRLKYALLQYNSLWEDTPVLKDGTISMGEIPNPLVSWEEDLYGFRYVNLTPWNYLSLSSTQLGLSMEGPINLGGTKYADYGLGVYNNASFHAFEQTNTKQVMGRVSVYPVGSDWRFQGLGLTGFYNYGYGNTAPDTADLPTVLKGPDAHISRIAALLHYSADQWGLAGEFDYGNNAFSSANLFSGSAPADEYGFPTGPELSTPEPWNGKCSSSSKCYSIFDTYGPQTAAYNAILNNGQSRQIGFDFFGHYHILETPLTAFGMFQWFLPNDKFHDDPLDFQRFVVGVSYQVNEFLRFAVDSQNTLFYHNQQARPISYLSQFGYVPGSSFNGLLLPATGDIPFLVPRDTHAIFVNMEFNY